MNIEIIYSLIIVALFVLCSSINSFLSILGVCISLDLCLAGVLQDTISVIIFNVALQLVYILWVIYKTRRIYENNLKFLPTISKSIPKDHPIRFENEIMRRRAKSDALQHREWESFSW